MTAPGSPDLPGPWPDVLAAYADGELDPPARVAVERWLAAHPGALADLRTQRQLSPENWRLWQRAEPPLPAEDTWAAVQDAVAAGAAAEPVAPAPASGWRRRVGVWVGVGLASAVAAAALAVGLGRVLPPPRGPDHADEVAPETADVAPPDDPLKDYPVLPIATDDDVDVRRVAGGGDVWLPIGGHPLPGPMVLATEDDVELEWADDHPAWPADGPQILWGVGDAPMIFAAAPR